VPLHLFVAHLPFALILVGAGVDLWGALARNPERRRWGGFLLMLGAFGALLAFFTGQGAIAYSFGRARPDFAAVEAHTQWAGAAVWPIVIAGGLRVAWRRRLDGVHGWITLAAGLLSALLIVGITMSGLAIAHGG
jgi:uncharacterized membrane protein